MPNNPIEKKARRLLQQIHDRTAPFVWQEYSIIPVAGILAIAASVSGKSFSDSFIKNVLQIDNSAARWVMLPPATIPAALLGFDSNINVLSRLSRFLRRLSLDDIKDNWTTIFPLLVATAGAVVNLKYKWIRSLLGLNN